MFVLSFRSTAVLAILVAGTAPAFAQAPPTGPLVLHVPATARTAALGNAWVAGRDQDVIFHNPAQLIGARPEFALSIMRLGPASTMLSTGSVYAAGKWSLTFGWGVQMLGFNGDAATAYPYSPDLLLAEGARSGSSTLVAAGAAILIKKFRIGVTGKYVSDLAAASGHTPLAAANHHAVLMDIGIARNLFRGAAAVAVQNIGRESRDNGDALAIPLQVALGWSGTRQAGPLDFGLFTQLTARKHWTAPAAGLEIGYSWLEGYTVTVRAGARRPETGAERPFALGAAFTRDRLTVEYGVRFFDDGRASNGVTLRWR